jgi:GNAT superfamily N-acetyltransferase
MDVDHQPEPITMRRLQVADVDDIMRIQLLCYGPNYLESRASFEVKIAASESCFGAFEGDRMLGYAIAFPWTRGRPVPLSCEVLEVPTVPDCFYMHDVAIDPVTHHRGLGARFVEIMLGEAGRLGLGSIELVAVQSAATYWERFGFEPIDGDVADYGPEAVRMRLSLPLD